ncbi:hypothetical protein [Bradyrhizobium valentinum]|nr:hypothetical protein [Bradyrhizobium valentinum]
MMVELLFIAQLARQPLQAVMRSLYRASRTAALPGMHEIVSRAF